MLHLAAKYDILVFFMTSTGLYIWYSSKLCDTTFNALFTKNVLKETVCERSWVSSSVMWTWFSSNISLIWIYRWFTQRKQMVTNIFMWAPSNGKSVFMALQIQNSAGTLFAIGLLLCYAQNGRLSGGWNSVPFTLSIIIFHSFRK